MSGEISRLVLVLVFFFLMAGACYVPFSGCIPQKVLWATKYQDSIIFFFACQLIPPPTACERPWVSQRQIIPKVQSYSAATPYPIGRRTPVINLPVPRLEGTLTAKVGMQAARGIAKGHPTPISPSATPGG